MTTLTDLDRHDPDLCTDPQCTHEAHLPDRVDTWTAADEAAWLWDDDVQRRRADRA